MKKELKWNIYKGLRRWAMWSLLFPDVYTKVDAFMHLDVN